ncbi:MAG: hypothetical protein IVW53_07835 [Chloroflexi bacterium]|nr:hypothetical protein [Chloroflexota bacterium]
MSRPRLAVAALLAIVGIVWFGQGIGAIGGSVMTGSSFWEFIGLACLVGAGVIAWRARRPPPPR